jgi:cobalt-zinc-cadmium efflux system outer membrane protein
VLLSLALRAAEPPPRVITAEACLARAADRSLTLQAGVSRTQAAAHLAQQAARRPNPRLGAEVENIAGSGGQSGIRAAETTLSLAQEIELGDKRRHRTAAAAAAAAVRRADEATERQTLLAEVRLAAVAVLAAQERVRCAEDILQLARETESVALAREAAGKTAALETERARAETARAALDVEERQAEQREAVYALAQAIGEREPSFDRVSGALGAPPAELPALDALALQAASHPALLAADAQAQALHAHARSALADGTPNLDVAAGVRRYEENDGYGLVAGVSIELPVSNRNRDAARAAEAEAEAAGLEAAAARVKNEAELRKLYARLLALAAKDARLRGAVLPSVERALALVMQAHQQGKAGYLDVLEARRAVAEAKLSLIDTRADYHVARAALDERAGAAAPSVP